MNKVLNINLGGYPFTVDEDAYDHLSRYLDTIHRHFRSSEGYEEITQDIEARLAELFRERLANRPIVTLKDVQAVIATMGTPEEFGAEPMESEASPGDRPRTSSSYRTGRRLFRDEDDKVIGGVASGIAAYLGISDPIWIRLAFIVFTVSGGFGIPLYVILWAILPKAETAGDRLSMRGEPINVSNIGRIIEEELRNLSDKVSEFGSELGSKKKSFSSGDGGDRTNPLAQGISFLGTVIRMVIDVIGKIWRPVLLVIGILLILAFAIAWIGSVVGIFYGMPFLDFFIPDQKPLAVLGAVNLLFLISVPLVSLLLGVARLLFQTRVSTAWRTGLAVFWGLNLVSLFTIAPWLARQFSTSDQVAQEISLAEPSADTLYLNAEDDPRIQDAWVHLDDDVNFSDNFMLLRAVHLSIRQSADSSFHLRQTISARGQSKADAAANARQISYEIRQENGRILFPSQIAIPRNGRWRVQEVELVLEVPRNKTVFLDDPIQNMLTSVDVTESEASPWSQSPRFWRMDEDGLACLDCR